ncbi:YciI family protein [Loktanella fryxellensis]|nr:YciI family protein [Loktanella fryxellensis]
MGQYFAANERMKADGVLLSGEGLQGIETATSLRIKSGKVETMDGPFAETREHLGGYYVIDAPDLDAALTYAALIPSAAFGTIEVRPLMDYNPQG